MSTIDIFEAPENMRKAMKKAKEGHERTILTWNGNPIAAIVPVDDVELVEAFEEAAERAADIEAVAEIEANPVRREDCTPWDVARERIRKARSKFEDVQEKA